MKSWKRKIERNEKYWKVKSSKTQQQQEGIQKTINSGK